MDIPKLFAHLPLLGPFLEPEPAGPEPRRRVDEVGDYEIHSVEYGRGDECVLLLHGLAGSSRWWRRNIPAFARRYRIIIPDLIGFGRSPLPERELPALDAVAVALANWMELRGIGRAHVVGHSMGGQIAIHMAADIPDRVARLVLVAAAGLPRPIGPRAVVQFLAGVVPFSSWGDPSFLPVIARDVVKTGPLTLLQAFGHILRDDVRPLLPRIEASTLVVWGEHDRLVPREHSRELEERISDARRVVIPSAAHNPMVDRADEFTRVVLRFLEGEAIGR